MNPIVIVVFDGIKRKIDVWILMSAMKIFIHALKRKHVSIHSSHLNAIQFLNAKKDSHLIVSDVVVSVSIIILFQEPLNDNLLKCFLR